MAKKLTKRELTIRGLLACGYRLDAQARTSKYEVYKLEGDVRKILVGRSGSLRSTRSTVARSISQTNNAYHKAMVIVGERADGYTSHEQARLDHADLHLKICRGELTKA